MSKKSQGQHRARYTLEFKLEAVRLVKAGQEASVTARVLGYLSPMRFEANWHAGQPFRMRLLHAVFAVTLAFVLALMNSGAAAQGLIDPGRYLPIEAVEVRLVNPSTDSALNSRLEDLVRRTLAAFPSDRYAEERVAASLARARRSTDIADISHTAEFGPTGGVVLRIVVTLSEGGIRAEPREALTERGAKDFPVLYEADGTLLRAKVETLGMKCSRSIRTRFRRSTARPASRASTSKRAPWSSSTWG